MRTLLRVLRALAIAPALVAMLVVGTPVLAALENNPRELEELTEELEKLTAESEVEAEGPPPSGEPPPAAYRRAAKSHVEQKLLDAVGFHSESRVRDDQLPHRIGNPRGPPKA